jgi:hypothetical protein
MVVLLRQRWNQDRWDRVAWLLQEFGQHPRSKRTGRYSARVVEDKPLTCTDG